MIVCNDSTGRIVWTLCTVHLVLCPPRISDNVCGHGLYCKLCHGPGLQRCSLIQTPGSNRFVALAAQVTNCMKQRMQQHSSRSFLCVGALLSVLIQLEYLWLGACMLNDVCALHGTSFWRPPSVSATSCHIFCRPEINARHSWCFSCKWARKAFWLTLWELSARFGEAWGWTDLAGLLVTGERGAVVVGGLRERVLAYNPGEWAGVNGRYIDL